MWHTTYSQMAGRRCVGEGVKEQMLKHLSVSNIKLYQDYVNLGRGLLGFLSTFLKHFLLNLKWLPGKTFKIVSTWASLVTQMVKNLPAMRENWVWSLGWEDPLEKGTATHSNILAWRTQWTKEPSGLQSMGSQRVWHNGATDIFYKFEMTSR